MDDPSLPSPDCPFEAQGQDATLPCRLDLVYQTAEPGGSAVESLGATGFALGV